MKTYKRTRPIAGQSEVLLQVYAKREHVGRNNRFSFAAMCCLRGYAGCWLCFANGSQSLKNCSTVLQHIVYNERITGSGRLEELVLMLCRILQRWEHKLFTMEGTSLPQSTSEALTWEWLRSGSRGRPFIPINPDQVEFFISVGRSMDEISQTLVISRRTLYRK